MAEPILQAAGTPTVASKPDGTLVAQTPTLGLNDPAFLKIIEDAYKQDATQKTQAASPEPKLDEVDPEPEDVLTPPKPEAKPEPKTEVKPEPVKDKARTKSEQWKQLHQLKDEAIAKQKEIEEKYRQLEERTKQFNPDEYSKIKQERDDFESRLKAFAVEHDPVFEQQMSSRLGRIKAEAESVLGDKASRFMSLLNLPEGEFKRQQLASMAAEMDEFAKYDMIQIASKHRELSLERGEYVKNARENYQKMIDAQVKQQEAFKARLMSEFDATVRQWQDPKTGTPVLQLKDGDQAWNSSVQETVTKARDILSGKLPAQEMINASLWSATAPRFLQAMNALQTENASLKQEIASLKAAGPDATKPGGGETQTETEDDYKGLSYGDIMAKKIAAAGGFAGR